MKHVKKFRDGIGFSFWNHFGNTPPTGTAVRVIRIKPGLFGLRYWGGENRVTVGFWWSWSIELVAAHHNTFMP